MKVTKKMLSLVNHVWKNKEDGTHAWYKYYNNYVTIESFNEDGEEFIQVLLVDNIDSLGYPYGKVLDVILLYEEDILKLNV